MIKFNVYHDLEAVLVLNNFFSGCILQSQSHSLAHALENLIFNFIEELEFALIAHVFM